MGLTEFVLCVAGVYDVSLDLLFVASIYRSTSLPPYIFYASVGLVAVPMIANAVFVLSVFCKEQKRNKQFRYLSFKMEWTQM